MQSEVTVRDKQKVSELVDQQDLLELKKQLPELHYADLGDLYESIQDIDKRAFLATAIGPEVFSSVISELPHSLVPEAIEAFETEGKRELLESLSDDDRVDILQAFEPEEQEHLLELLQKNEEKVTRDLMKYEESTAGGRMTRRFGRIKEDMTVSEAIAHLSKDQDETEMLARIYVVDEDDHLLGKVRLRELTFNDSQTLIKDIMSSVEATVMAKEDQEVAANILLKYDMFAIPVVDEFDKLLGIITHDDIVEIIHEETTEDMEKIAGISGDSSEETYLSTSLLNHFIRRVQVLFPLALLAIISGWAMWKFEDTLTVIFELAIYFPMVIAAGGNSGGQASTVVIRAMSIGEINQGEARQVIMKELFIGIVMGLALGVSLLLIISLCLPAMGTTTVGEGISIYYFALTIGVALFMQITISTVCGATLPLAARAMKIDPALISSPAITTIVDLLGVVIYFTTAQLILNA